MALEGDSACLGLGGWLLIGTGGKELGFGRPALNGRIVWQGLLFSLQRVLLCTLCLQCFACCPLPQLKASCQGRTADHDLCPPLPQSPLPMNFLEPRYTSSDFFLQPGLLWALFFLNMNDDRTHLHVPEQ